GGPRRKHLNVMWSSAERIRQLLAAAPHEGTPRSARDDQAILVRLAVPLRSSSPRRRAVERAVAARPPDSPVVDGRYTCRRAPPVTRVSGDHTSGSRALVIFEVIHLQLRTQVRDNVPRCRASTLPPLHTASMSDLRGSPPT